jgi:class 3 adenylate cyclase
MVGDSCFVAIGHDRPLFDHAPRAVALATSVVAEVDRDVDGGGVRAAAGVATGRVDVGLGGASRLVYDIWGPTVTEAYATARSAEPGTVRVTATTATLLPAEVATEPVDAGDGLRVVLVAEEPGTVAP